jgi:hypothetical protein
MHDETCTHTHTHARTRNSGLLTGGGKNDGTVKLWRAAQWQQQQQQGADGDARGAAVLKDCAKLLPDVGYSFDLALLPDSTPGSKRYALAAARYNKAKLFV